MQQSIEYYISVAKKLGQNFCGVTCDQAIYKIVLRLKKKQPVKYTNAILRTGGFNIAMNFSGAIVKLMKGSKYKIFCVKCLEGGGGVCQEQQIDTLQIRTTMECFVVIV